MLDLDTASYQGFALRFASHGQLPLTEEHRQAVDVGPGGDRQLVRVAGHDVACMLASLHDANENAERALAGGLQLREGGLGDRASAEQRAKELRLVERKANVSPAGIGALAQRLIAVQTSGNG